MSAFTEQIMQRAAADRKTIVLPEGADPRTLTAAIRARDARIADIIVLADESSLASHLEDLSGIRFINPTSSPDKETLAKALYELRKDKGLTREECSALLDDELYYGVMMVKTGQADGMVAGAAHSTSDVLRPCLQILKTAPGSQLVSAFFVIIVPDCPYGVDGAFVFADCGLVQYPDSIELAHIALSSAESFSSLIGGEPVVALLSHSTHGSAKGPSIDKVREALTHARSLKGDLLIDGEFQLDSALVPSVGAAKAPGSSVAGRANVLVFPDLDSGNIAYKLAQRLARAEAYGPITQGLARPVNDLSRGATPEDIVGVIAITAVQAQNQQSQA